MQRWRDLLSGLEIIESSSDCLFTEDELIESEAKLGFILPAAYKEFCQVFGSGSFGDFIEILCPTFDTVASSTYGIEAMKSSRVMLSISQKENIDTNSILALLDSAFTFGGNDAYTALWDLRTYGEIDQSYDIYWTLSSIYPGENYLVGRDFFEFVRDFCLGEKPYEVLPEDTQPLPGMMSKTFTRIAN